MKIAHIVTYIDELGSFGGPARVATSQAAALAALGHEVTVYAAAPQTSEKTVQVDGYTLKLFRGKRLIGKNGFAFLHSAQLTRALRREAASFDVAHIHLARDLVTLPAARIIHRHGVSIISQTHGMIDSSTKFLARPLDAFLTRSALRQSQTVLVLTETETADLQSVEPKVVTERINNGICIRNLPAYEGRANRVLFLARLQERKRPLAFVQMAIRLKDSLPDTEFVLVGPDEGEGASVAQAIADSGMGDRLQWVGPTSPEMTDEWMESSRVYVLPAVNEIFPMTIIEALRSGTPVVTTGSLGIAANCEKYGAAVLTDGLEQSLAAAVLSILKDQKLAQKLRRGGLTFIKEELDITGVAKQLEELYLGSQK